MGNLSSHEPVETLREYCDPYNFESYDDWVAPISNDEQFLRKWHRLVARRLELADNDAFRQVFEAVGCVKGETGYWSEQTFIEVFTRTTRYLYTTPQDAQLFYELVLKLGSYPYITNPPFQGKVLGLDFLTFKAGLMALSGRLTSMTPIASGFKFSGTAGRKHRRILFLALAKIETAPLTPEDEGLGPRTDDDDEDLLDVLKLFEACRWEGPNPCLTYHGPRLPHRTAFRSSHSVPVGTVRVDKVWQLLRLLLVVKLWQYGIDMQSPSVQVLDWRGEIGAIMASGGSNPKTPTGYLEWPEFDSMFATIPRAFESLNPLFKPFISSDPSHVFSLDTTNQGSNTHVSHHLQTLPGKILTLPLLSQILCSTWSNTLYTSLALNAHDLSTHNLEYSGPLSTFHSFLAHLPSATKLQKQALIMLSGTIPTTAQNFTGGIYLNNNLDEFTTTFLFQLRPSNRSFAADREPGEPECAERMQTRSAEVLETTVKSRAGGEANMTLPLQEGGVGALRWQWDECGTGIEEFQISTVEYISFGREE